MNGPYSLETLLEIKKAFEANTADGGAEPFVQVGSSGAALSMQSLDRTYVATVSSDDDFRFLKQVPRRTISQVIAEYNKLSSHGGGWYRSSYIGQSDEPSASDSVLDRLYNEVNYIAERFEFNKVVDSTQNAQDPEVVQSNSALRRGMENMSRNFWFGDRSINKFKQDGFLATVSKMSSDFVQDARGQLPEAGEFKHYSAEIRSKFFGKVNQAWMHPGTKALYDQIYSNGSSGNVAVIQNQSQDPSDVKYGNIVSGIPDSNASKNFIKFEDDIWLDRHNWDVPLVRDPNGNWVEGPTSDNAPGTPTVALAAIPSVPGSKFTSSWEGSYKYRVCAGNLRDWSQASTEAAVTVAVGGGVSLTITAASGIPATEFAIFRETKANSGIIKYMREIPKTGANTIFQDLNEDLPGTSIIVMGDFNAQSTSDEKRTLVLSELLGFTKTLFPYGAGGKLRMRQGMVEHYGVLQILAGEKFRVWKNVPAML
ncbi:capsid protein [Leptospira langatensis]|uniref:Capsid protein n=1 Tax=Leptospira langatensis TaxID=2484983 RepID=A0A5R2ATR6_9LEPT|nr:capsid protein [Leptospira langatensis]TGJ99849.1 capsid protein [Leptospira langatensis]